MHRALLVLALVLSACVRVVPSTPPRFCEVGILKKPGDTLSVGAPVVYEGRVVATMTLTTADSVCVLIDRMKLAPTALPVPRQDPTMVPRKRGAIA